MIDLLFGRVGLLAEFGKLRSGLRFQLFDFHFKASGRYGEFSAKLIFVGTYGTREPRKSFGEAG
jgi:hypothetical protein